MKPARLKMIVSVLDIGKGVRTVEQRFKVNFLLLNVSIHLFEVGFRSHGNAPIRISYDICTGWLDLLQFGCLLHQPHDISRRPVSVEPLQKAHY